jgi:hypothetical protein
MLKTLDIYYIRNQCSRVYGQSEEDLKSYQIPGMQIIKRSREPKMGSAERKGSITCGSGHSER